MNLLQNSLADGRRQCIVQHYINGTADQLFKLFFQSGQCE